ncbi:MAG TPA: hypothetical protein ENJ09_15955 [Planctomycetes bacterium]|nr:hypothetical protein [Planctomycetota bacterium]
MHLPWKAPRSLWRRARPWILGALFFFPWSLFALSLVPRLVFPGTVWIALASAAAAGALGLWVVRRRFLERRTVRVGYRVRFADPLVPVVGRTTLRMEVFSERVDRGRSRREEQCSIEARLRGTRSERALAWCCGQIEAHLQRAARQAEESYPDHRIVRAPAPTPGDLLHRLDHDRGRGTAGFGERAWDRALSLGAEATGWVAERFPSRRRARALPRLASGPATVDPVASAEVLHSVSDRHDAW